MAARLARGGGALTSRPSSKVLLAHGMARPVPLRNTRGLHTATCAQKGFGVPISKSPKNKCPCGSGTDFSGCCQKLHSVQQLKASGPEQLLRARFSAYVKKDWKYVLRTTHSNNPAQQGSTSGEAKRSLEEDIKGTMRWTDVSNLKIIQVQPGASPAQANIDFKYSVRQLFELKTGAPIMDPPCTVISETATFEVEDGDWKLLGSQSDWDRHSLETKS